MKGNNFNDYHLLLEDTMKKLILSTENSTMYITTDQQGTDTVPHAKSPDHSIRLNKFWLTFAVLVLIGFHMIAYFGFIY